MNIRLFNSLSGKVEDFLPIKKGQVSMYVCGPTIYDDVHVGNLRPVVVFDTLRRFFLHVGYDVIFVSNFTDIDDKIIDRALKENKSELEIANRYIDVYNRNVENVNAMTPTYTPRVTTSINEIIKFIEELVKKGAAYEKDGDVFFRVSEDKNYGHLANIKLEDLVHGARIDENDKKEHPADFLLWKRTEVGITFSSPWGEGRPGWHTECVVMINKTFKQPLIDIHGGGFDLKFPHHENEMAQSRAYSGTNLANYWMHNGFISVNNEKMSKSLGNTLTATDFINKYGGNTLRLLLLSGHYRSPLNLTDEVISNNQKEVEKISNAIRQLAVYLQLNGGKLNKTAHINNEFLETLADDLNTANAISILFGVIKTINTKLRKPNKEIETLENLFVESNSMLDLLGLKINYPELDKNDIQLYTQYKEAKEKKDFAKSDEIRDKLIERGIL